MNKKFSKRISIYRDVNGEYHAKFEYDKKLISIVKKDGRGKWNGSNWELSALGVVDLVDTYQDLIDIDNIDMEELRRKADNEPKPGFIRFGKCDEGYCARFLYDEDLICKVKNEGYGIWHPEKGKKYWELRPSKILYLLEEYKSICCISDKILAEVQDCVASERDAAKQRVLRQEANEKYWAIPAEERLRHVTPNVEYDFKSTPYPHQIEALNFIVTWKKILVADEPGLGKTAESIYASDYLHKSNKSKKCLIICGVNTIKYNWLEEINFHSDEQAILIDGTENDRLKAIDKWRTTDSVYYAVINIEALRKDDIRNNLNGIADCIICDEIHKAKNGRSQQGRALRSLDAPYKIGLTGTPIDNKVEDLYNILAWLDVEKRTFREFRNAYCILDPKWGTVIAYRNLADLKNELSSVMIRRKKSDVVSLPAKIYKTEYVDLSVAEQKMYKKLQNGIFLQIDKIMNMENPLSSILHLREVTGGLYTTSRNNAKLNRIKEILSEEIIPAGKKAIIFSKYEGITRIYKHELAEYHPAYITGNVDPRERQKEIARFQNVSDCKICIGTISAMGTGITLTAATTVIFADKEWTISANRQAEDRAHRIGTRESINIITVVAKNTIDEYVEKLLNDKEMYTDLIMEGEDVVLDKTNRAKTIAGLLGISLDELNRKVEAQKALKRICKEKDITI